MVFRFRRNELDVNKPTHQNSPLSKNRRDVLPIKLDLYIVSKILSPYEFTSAPSVYCTQPNYLQDPSDLPLINCNPIPGAA